MLKLAASLGKLHLHLMRGTVLLRYAPRRSRPAGAGVAEPTIGFASGVAGTKSLIFGVSVKHGMRTLRTVAGAAPALASTAPHRLSIDQSAAWEFTAADALAAHGRRREFGAFLRCHGTPESDYEAAEIIFGELVANVVQHAPGPIRICVEWLAESPVLHVHDRGDGFAWQPSLPRDPLTESKRGLFIIQSLSSDVAVRNRDGGTRVSVVLPIERRAT